MCALVSQTSIHMSSSNGPLRESRIPVNRGKPYYVPFRIKGTISEFRRRLMPIKRPREEKKGKEKGLVGTDVRNIYEGANGWGMVS